MLTHPTTNRLRELGLAGMARALEEVSALRTGSPCWSTARRWNATANAWRRDCALPDYASKQHLKMSITVPGAVWIGLCSSV